MDFFSVWEKRGNFDQVSLRSAYHRNGPRREAYPKIDGKGDDVVGESLVVPRQCIGHESRAARTRAHLNQISGREGRSESVVLKISRGSGALLNHAPHRQDPLHRLRHTARRLEILSDWYICRYSTLCMSLSARLVGVWCSTSGERLACTNGDGNETRQAANDHVLVASPKLEARVIKSPRWTDAAPICVETNLEQNSPSCRPTAMVFLRGYECRLTVWGIPAGDL
jgi:hypothetical protein